MKLFVYILKAEASGSAEIFGTKFQVPKRFVNPREREIAAAEVMLDSKMGPKKKGRTVPVLGYRSNGNERVIDEWKEPEPFQAFIFP